MDPEMAFENIPPAYSQGFPEVALQVAIDSRGTKDLECEGVLCPLLPRMSCSIVLCYCIPLIPSPESLLVVQASPVGCEPSCSHICGRKLCTSECIYKSAPPARLFWVNKACLHGPTATKLTPRLDPWIRVPKSR